MKKSFIAVFSAAAIAISGLGATSAYASVFSDIDTVPWAGAAQYIDEAYSLGLMAGYEENGQKLCKPRNNVTYCEAVQFMYSIMSAYSGTSVSSSVVSKWTSTMASKNIPSWAYNAVAYALENSILSQNDISIFMASSTTQNNARREDVAVIFGKALSKVYSLSSSPTLTYADKGSIASTSIPYVELLNRLDIMVGDENNNFNPKVNINRAEMSVIVSKTYNLLKNGGGSTTTPGTVVQYAGKITQKTSSGSGYSISVSVDGSTKTFTTNASTTVTGVSGSSSTVAKLSTGDSIVAVCNRGVATTIIVMAEGTSSTTTKSGTINSISEDEIVVKTSSGSKTYEIEDDDITVTIDGSNSSLSTLVSRFKGGRNYTVTVHLDDDDVVTKIEAKEGTDSGDYDEDAIESISKTSVKTYGGDRYYFPDDIEDYDDLITLDGDEVDYDEFKDAFDDLDDDEQMIITDYELDDDDELEMLEVEIDELETSSSSSSSDKSGLVTSISSSRVEINDDKDYDFADIDDIDTLKFDGEKYDTDEDGLDDFVSDIKDEDEVYIELTLDKNDDIIEAVAYTCDTEDGELTNVTSSKIEIDEDNEYTYDSSTTISVKDGNTTITTKSKLEDAFDDEKVMEVTVVYNDEDEAVAITGYVKEIGETTIDDFEYDDDNDPDECYIKLDNNSSSIKYYFDDAWKIGEIKDIYDDYRDNKEDAEIKLNDEGKIKSITLS